MRAIWQPVDCCTLPGSESHYLWEGVFTKAHETVLIATTSDQYTEKARQVLAVLHPYECPAILDFGASASPGFAERVAASIGRFHKVNKQD